MRSTCLLVIAAALLFSCSGEERHRPRPVPPPREDPAPEPVVAPETLPAAREVRFSSSDGVHLVGTLQPAAHPDAPAVVLLHQLGSTRAEWAPLLARLHAQPALTTLAIDMRGHGASTEGPSGALDFHAFDGAQWAAAQEDVLAAIAFLRSADSGVQPSGLAAIGSSIGSSAVIAAAAREPSLSTLVTLSPGRAYHGFDAITPAIGLGDRAILAIVASAETDGVDTAQALSRIAHTPAIVVDGDAHGVALFTLDATTLDRVDAFVREHVATPPPPAAAEPTSS